MNTDQSPRPWNQETPAQALLDVAPAVAPDAVGVPTGVDVKGGSYSVDPATGQTTLIHRAGADADAATPQE